MSIIKEVKARHLQARKNKEVIAKNLLTTLVGDLGTLAKNEQIAVTDIDDLVVIGKIKKYITTAKDNIEAGVDAELCNAEIEILESFLPSQMTESELQEKIDMYILSNNVDSMRGMGIVMKELTANFGGRFDGKLASTLVKKTLA